MIEKALKILENENIDLEEFETSEEYKKIVANSEPLSVYRLLNGFSVTITGDLEKIIFYGIDEIKLFVIYSLRSDVFSKQQVAVINVCDQEHKEFVRRYLHTNTKVKIIAKYDAVINGFKLISIESASFKMKYGFYLCPKCGYNFGRKPDGDYCLLCGNKKLVYKDNFYSEDSCNKNINQMDCFSEG